MSSTQAVWPAVLIIVETVAAEAIESALNNAGALGTEINLLGQRSAPQNTTVVGYFAKEPNREFLRSAIVEELRINGFGDDSISRFEFTRVADRDWLAEWKRHWRPVEVGKFIIAPPWADVAATDHLIIRIEPNMAFGTGTHETTRLCLEAISKLYRPGQSFLDVGTGTGILAIAAAKMAAINTVAILACDTDADSIRIARENATANGVDNVIEFRAGSISGRIPAHDFTCANLTLDVILPILPILAARTRHILVLSGILLEQRDLIERELAKSEISEVIVETLGEWIAVTVFLDRAS